MADLSQKKASFIRRYVSAVEALLQSANGLNVLATEWTANSYPTGADPSGNNITDSDLAVIAPWLTAEQLNLGVGAAAAVNVTVDEQRGYLEAVRA